MAKTMKRLLRNVLFLISSSSPSCDPLQTGEEPYKEGGGNLVHPVFIIHNLTLSILTKQSFKVSR